MIDMPYFMKNDSWYYVDREEGEYKLTDDAPEEARKSYDEYIEYMNNEKKYS